MLGALRAMVVDAHVQPHEFGRDPPVGPLQPSDADSQGSNCHTLKQTQLPMLRSEPLCQGLGFTV